MTERLELYRCELCGNIVQVAHVGGGTLVCCGQAMTAQEDKTADWTTEKHVPVVEKVEGGFKVSVGSTVHPMVDDHWIQWIEVRAGDRVIRQFLNPGDAPEAFFPIDAESVEAREYCNLHGQWKA